MNTLKDRLIYARTLRGLSQADLAAAVKCSQSTIGNAESGLRKTLRDVVRVARALGVSPDWLSDGKGDKPLPAAVCETSANGSIGHQKAKEKIQTLKTKSNTNTQIRPIKSNQPEQDRQLSSWPFTTVEPLDYARLSQAQKNELEELIMFKISKANKDPPAEQLSPANNERTGTHA